MFEREGFVRVRPLGRNHWVIATVRRPIVAATDVRGQELANGVVRCRGLATMSRSRTATARSTQSLPP